MPPEETTNLLRTYVNSYVVRPPTVPLLYLLLQTYSWRGAAVHRLPWMGARASCVVVVCLGLL